MTGDTMGHRVARDTTLGGVPLPLSARLGILVGVRVSGGSPEHAVKRADHATGQGGHGLGAVFPRQ